MKILHSILALFAVSLFLVSCESDYEPAHEITPNGGFVRWDTETEKINFLFDLTENPNPVFEGPIMAPSGNVASYDLSFSLVTAQGTQGPFFLKSVTTLPTTLTFSAQEVADAANLELDEVKGRLDFNAVVTNTNGQSFTTEDFTGDLFNPGQRQAMQFSINILCPSDLGGTFDYVQTDMQAAGSACDGEITGTVTWTETSEGAYDISDVSFGLFGHCYGDSPAVGPTLNDACDVISLSGSDQYGDSYTYTVVKIEGPVMTLEWTNTFNDGGTVVLTRQDGNDWPQLGS